MRSNCRSGTGPKSVISKYQTRKLIRSITMKLFIQKALEAMLRRRNVTEAEMPVPVTLGIIICIFSRISKSQAGTPNVRVIYNALINGRYINS